MAALLKKRALAEYSQTVVQEQPKPLKKLRLVKKVTTTGSGAAYLGMLEKSKTSHEAMQALIRISDPLKFEEEGLPEAVKKLSEHYQQEKEKSVRLKILTIFQDISKETGADIPGMIDHIMTLLKKEVSNKVLAHGLSVLLGLGKVMPDSTAIHQKIVNFAKQFLVHTSYRVICKSLMLIGELLPINTSTEGSSQTVLRLLGDFTHSEDGRVRGTAFTTLIILHERGLKLDVSVYSEVCVALKDDCELVRQESMKCVWLLGTTYPEHTTILPDSEEEIRLVDDAFGKICNMITDLSMNIREQAATFLGSMTIVSQRFLQQTLDKKLMSNMRKKRSAHERAWESVTSGEWSSGKSWGDDRPRELLDKDSVNLMSSGACGAFVHGLEDEFLEVRTAAVNSLYLLSMNNHQFACQCLDFLVDMLNDEIEGVRIKAIDTLVKISKHIVLREDQLEIILGALKDFSINVREGLHRALSSCRLASKICLQMCVETLLDNLKKYPVDKRSTWRCLQKIGQMHPELTLPLVPELLTIHPFFDTPEPDVEDPSYISILILLFNAAKHCPTMLQLFEEHTVKHYNYLLDTLPNLVPVLKLPGASRESELSGLTSSTEQFLNAILARVEVAPNPRARWELLEATQRDLNRMSSVNSAIPGAIKFAELSVSSQLLLMDVLANKMWSNPSSLATQQGNVVKLSITQLLKQCLMLQYLFVGLKSEELSYVKQFKLKVLSLHLVYIVRGSNSSALALCEHFLEQAEDTQKFLSDNNLQPDPYTATLFRELGSLEETKPGPVARCLLPLLQNSVQTPLPRANTAIRSSTAVISEPRGDIDTPLKFTAGLVVGVQCDAELHNMKHTESLRIKVKYPDQQTQLLIPKSSDLRPLDSESPGEEKISNPWSDYRLLTTTLISHQVWTEACTVDVSLALDISQVESGLLLALGRKGGTNVGLKADVDPCILDLCKPVKVYVSPKAVKRGI